MEKVKPLKGTAVVANEVGKKKIFASEEEIKSILESAGKKCEDKKPRIEYDKDDVLVNISDSVPWTTVDKVSCMPSVKIVPKSITDRIREWGTNLLYNAKDGKNIWYALLGDKKLDLTQPAHILSKKYYLMSKSNNASFYESLRNQIWMTYRTDFSPLLDTITSSVATKIEDKEIDLLAKKLYSSDNGWGCTIRVGQMALANALIRHIYKDSFSLQAVVEQGITNTPYSKILLSFWDNGKKKNFPFSIQNVAEVVIDYNKLPGEWLSQSTVATILKDLNKKYTPYKDLEIVTFIDGIVFEDQLKEACKSKKAIDVSTIPVDYDVIDSSEYDEFMTGKKTPGDSSQGCVLFISCSLGLQSAESIYLKPLKKIFKLHHLVGIMGGRANEALFFIGYQDDNFIFLDPHFVQPTIDRIKIADQYTTYHCSSAKVLNYSKLDTSICIVLYAKDLTDLEVNLLPTLKELSKEEYSLIQVSTKTITEHESGDDPELVDLCAP